ncbi:hypothetical protein M0R72_16020 [Candidatus Pacearchaeota archaeon]|jgi:hypothetical protein|nr:hypothetical protein [Candidatus Pacearchaeota archaeon]
METIEKIVLPEDESIVLALKKKFIEYTERMKVRREEHPKMGSESFNKSYSHALYKMLILGRLLDKKELDALEFSSEIEKNMGFVDAEKYSDAVGVIDDYCKTGGKNTHGGTGLKLK